MLKALAVVNPYFILVYARIDYLNGLVLSRVQEGWLVLVSGQAGQGRGQTDKQSPPPSGSWIATDECFFFKSPEMCYRGSSIFMA